MKTCFFIGHREAGDELFPLLIKTVERYVLEYGVTQFVVGNYGGFDRVAAQVIKKIKQKYCAVTLLLLLPYHPSKCPIQTPDGFDGTYYPDGMETVPARFAIVRANRLMVDRSDFLIAFSWRTASNAGKLLEYAQKRAQQGVIQVENLAEQFPIPQARFEQN